MLSNLKFLFLVSLGFWGPLSAMILGRFSSLIILNSTSNFFHGKFSQELSLQRNLQTLILNNNMLNGTLPEWISALPGLTFMIFKNNSLSGPLSNSLSTLQRIRIITFRKSVVQGSTRYEHLDKVCKKLICRELVWESCSQFWKINKSSNLY